STCASRSTLSWPARWDWDTFHGRRSRTASLVVEAKQASRSGKSLTGSLVFNNERRRSLADADERTALEAGGPLFFLLLDDDARRDHDQEAARAAAIADVAEQSIQHRNLAQ